ncbi:hypothetical protein [Lapillicoccus sp.]|uniref:hypothetical protein n=1 Tax=Lapillicoccus sp. TaxID=1909287 RepID=UPI0039833A57
MAEKDVDEQFAAIMAHWDEEALGLDPFGDPSADRNPGDPDGGTDAGASATLPSAVNPAPIHGLEPRTTPSAGPPPLPVDKGEPDEPVEPLDKGEPVAAEDDAQTPGGVPEEPPPVVGAAWRQHNPPEVEEHFEPPPLAPLPSAEDKHFWTMLGALVGGPLVFLYLLLFNRDGNGWWITFALLVTVAGFVLLVLRQPNHRDEDDHGIRL